MLFKKRYIERLLCDKEKALEVEVSARICNAIDLSAVPQLHQKTSLETIHPNLTKLKPHKPQLSPPNRYHTMKLNILLLSAAALVNAASATLYTSPTAVDLGVAGDYVILAKTGIATVPSSTITGDIGVSPIAATAITGFGLTMDSKGQFSTSSQITGQAFAASYGFSTETKLTSAVGAMELAYDDADRRAPDVTNVLEGTGNIGDQNFTRGVYSFNSDITFDKSITFSGSANDVFIMQTSGSVLQAAGTSVILVGGALPENIFWQVAGHFQVGAGSVMKGVVLVKTDALFMTGSTLDGRVLAQTACNIEMAVITEA
jgi:hypothetical protein